MNLIAIDEPEDPRVAAYRDIRERDLVGRDGLFVAEGEVVVRLLLSPASRFRARSVLVDARRVVALRARLAAAGDIPIYAASQAVLDRVAGFHLNRGLLAIGEIGDPPTAADLLGSAGRDAMVVVCCGIANHDNLGGIFRNAAAFGAAAVVLDAACCDPLYRKAIRVSVGTSLVVPFAKLLPEDDALAVLAASGFEVVMLSPKGDIELADLSIGRPVAVVLGSEGPGLPAEMLARAKAVRISMAAGIDSLNVAVTSGIVLHHLASSRDDRPPE